MSPPSQEKKSTLDKLHHATCRADLAKMLGYKPSALTSILYKTPVEQKYKSFNIPKKSGGIRSIKAPTPKLKQLQSRLSGVLYECLDEIQNSKNISPVSFAFRKEGSIVLNAKKHKRKRYVFNIDLEDFFPSFNFGRVRGFFLKDNNFQLSPDVATAIAQIACDGKALPQGSPCSPIISELIGQILDLRLLRLAKKHGVTYSRYADDITFSTNQKAFPSSIAIESSVEPDKWVVGQVLEDKITHSGFSVNKSKTRMHFRGSQQIVNGLIVNEKVNITSSYYRYARAMCDSLFQKGYYYKQNNSSGNKKALTRTDTLEGILSHIYYVTQQEELRPKKLQRSEPRAIRKLYRRFLFYKYCIMPEIPFIITEGKTDPIYLKEAIRSRRNFYPILAEETLSGFRFKIKFFRYGSQAQEIMDLGGGTGDLKSIPLDYNRNVVSSVKGRKPFRSLPLTHPVIMLVDNDSGLTTIASTIKKIYKIEISIDSVDDFYHVTKNLYLVKTPENHGESCIENLFPEAWLQHKLNGKDFNFSGKINTDKEYGKEVFAKSVVQKHASSIDFSGFDVLLDRIVGVIEHYKAI